MSNRSRSVTRTTSYTVGTVTTFLQCVCVVFIRFCIDLVKSMCCYLVTLHFNKSQRWLKCHEKRNGSNVVKQTNSNYLKWLHVYVKWIMAVPLVKTYEKNGWLINSSTEDHRFCLLSTIYCKIIMYFFPPLNFIISKKNVSST